MLDFLSRSKQPQHTTKETRSLRSRIYTTSDRKFDQWLEKQSKGGKKLRKRRGERELTGLKSCSSGTPTLLSATVQRIQPISGTEVQVVNVTNDSKDLQPQGSQLGTETSQNAFGVSSPLPMDGRYPGIPPPTSQNLDAEDSAPELLRSSLSLNYHTPTRSKSLSSTGSFVTFEQQFRKTRSASTFARTVSMSAGQHAGAGGPTTWISGAHWSPGQSVRKLQKRQTVAETKNEDRHVTNEGINIEDGPNNPATVTAWNRDWDRDWDSRQARSAYNHEAFYQDVRMTAQLMDSIRAFHNQQDSGGATNGVRR